MQWLACLERLVVDLYGVGEVLGQVAVGGPDHRHRLARIARALQRQGIPGTGRQAGPVDPQGIQTESGAVGRVGRQRDRSDPGVRVGRAHECCVHALEGQVGQVAPAPRDQALPVIQAQFRHVLAEACVHSVHDRRVPGAAADVRAQQLAQLLLLVTAPGPDQLFGRQQETRRAEPALKGAPLEELFLKGREAIATQAFDSDERAPAACTASRRQDRTALPSRSTVQAPHTPCSQPRWVPVSPSPSRSRSASVVRPLTSPSQGRPLTSNPTSIPADVSQ